MIMSHHDVMIKITGNMYNIKREYVHYIAELKTKQKVFFCLFNFFLIIYDIYMDHIYIYKQKINKQISINLNNNSNITKVSL